MLKFSDYLDILFFLLCDCSNRMFEHIKNKIICLAFRLSGHIYFSVIFCLSLFGFDLSAFKYIPCCYITLNKKRRVGLYFAL